MYRPPTNRELLIISGVILLQFWSNGVAQAENSIDPDIASRRAAFITADTNRDDRLSWPEFREAVKKILSKQHDFQARAFHLLMPGEQDALLRSHFDTMDKNHKGYLLFSDWKDQN